MQWLNRIHQNSNLREYYLYALAIAEFQAN